MGQESNDGSLWLIESERWERRKYMTEGWRVGDPGCEEKSCLETGS